MPMSASSPTSKSEVADGVALPQRYWAILTIMLGLTMAVIDGTIANIALPTIAQDLHATPSFSIWIVNGYQLAVMISVLPLSSLGDIIGYRPVYLTGLALFTIASLFCAASHSLLELTAARFVQGLGASAIMSVNGALVRFIYPHRMLGRGIGINALVVALSSAFGPPIAAGILAVGSWPYLFVVNLPFGIAALAIGARALPHTPRGSHGFDWQSAVTSAIVFGVGIAAIDGFGHGQPPLYYTSEIAIATAAGVMLVRRQQGIALPLLPVDLLRIPIFALSISASVVTFCAQMLAFVALPFFFKYRFGFSASEIGLAITPWPIATAFAAALAGRLVDRYPAGLLGAIGLVMFSCGLLALAMLPAHATMLNIIWRMAASGAGFGLFQAPNNRTIIAAAPRERSGGASGLQSTARLLGQTVGAAFVALLLARDPAGGAQFSIFLGSGCAIAAVILSTLRLSPAGGRGAETVQIVEGRRMTGD